MRRRKKTPEGELWDGTVPAELVVFDESQWPGVEPWECWEAWWAAGIEWAEAKMPNGHEGLLDEMRAHNGGTVPDCPWNPAVI